MALRNNEVYVIGHKNPDTDSICSAIAYSYLKNQVGEHVYVPRRAGEVNEETRYVLNRFRMSVPEYIADVRTQIKDISIRETEGVDRTISLKKAWALMKELNVVTLPVTKHGRLEGVITTEDIAESYMDVYDSNILSRAHTRYSNIVETLDGSMVVGSKDEYYTKGKVLIAAANPDLMESYIEEDDLVILGNRYESQLCAIEMNAGCIVVCDGAEVSLTIKRLAQEHGCTVISSPHDTYTVARLINQSMAISYFMTRENLITFRTDAFTDDIRSVMAKKRFRDFPIVNKKGEYVGMISRRNLLTADRKKVIMVDHNEKSQAVDGLEEAEILEIIDHHRLGSIQTMSPVFFRNQPLGCTATIVYQLFCENGQDIPKDIAGILCSAILSDTLMYRSPTCTAVDRFAAERLADIAEVNAEELASEMFRAGSNLKTKSAEEIFYQDFKKFSMEGVSLGVGQINSMNTDELAYIKEKLLSYLERAYKEHGVQIIYFMLTSIIDESTEILCAGEDAERLIEESFGVKTKNASAVIKGMVSRKKQLIPAIMETLSSSAVHS